MARLVTAILSQQGELAARARQCTGDVNEAGLLVGKVVSRAFLTFGEGGSEQAISTAMRRDLEALIKRRQSGAS